VILAVVVLHALILAGACEASGADNTGSLENLAPEVDWGNTSVHVGLELELWRIRVRAPGGFQVSSSTAFRFLRNCSRDLTDTRKWLS
jgi:hypothetical protein